MPQTTVTQHTIGPWRTERDLGTTHVLGADRLGSVICDVRAYSEAPRETAANARLIAAAPDLLASLKDMHAACAALMRAVAAYGNDAVVDAWGDELKRLGLPDGVGATAETVIARAEGR